MGIFKKGNKSCSNCVYLDERTFSVRNLFNRWEEQLPVCTHPSNIKLCMGNDLHKGSSRRISRFINMFNKCKLFEKKEPELTHTDITKTEPTYMIMVKNGDEFSTLHFCGSKNENEDYVINIIIDNIQYTITGSEENDMCCIYCNDNNRHITYGDIMIIDNGENKEPIYLYIDRKDRDPDDYETYFTETLNNLEMEGKRARKKMEEMYYNRTRDRKIPEDD